jgi:hypothetical protein
MDHFLSCFIDAGLRTEEGLSGASRWRPDLIEPISSFTLIPFQAFQKRHGRTRSTTDKQATTKILAGTLPLKEAMLTLAI